MIIIITLRVLSGEKKGTKKHRRESIAADTLLRSRLAPGQNGALQTVFYPTVWGVGFAALRGRTCSEMFILPSSRLCAFA